MKICALIPVYMSDNSREINLKNLRLLKETEFKYIDEVVICDQNFQESDYIEGFTYLGPYSKLPNGLAQARNILFKWFYNSDYDYALLLDARERLSKSSLNSFVSLCGALKYGNTKIDYVQGTLGLMASKGRQIDKERGDYFDTVRLSNKEKPLLIGLHHVFISNFKKKYNMELYIDEEKVSSSGHITDSPVFEDQYFIELVGRYFTRYNLYDMVVNLGPQKASLWATDSKSESAKETGYREKLDEMLKGIGHNKFKEKAFDYIYIVRLCPYHELMTEYKPRKKKEDKCQISLDI